MNNLERPNCKVDVKSQGLSPCHGSLGLAHPSYPRLRGSQEREHLGVDLGYLKCFKAIINRTHKVGQIEQLDSAMRSRVTVYILRWA